jgi:hypothetical protein
MVVVCCEATYKAGVFLTVMIEIIGSLFVHPFGNVRNGGPGKESGASKCGNSASVCRTISKSCLNCLSEDTVWPWYSKVAPFSWMVERTSQGRETR